MPRALTIRKERWHPPTDDKVLKGGVLNPSAAMQERYYVALAKLVHIMTAGTERELRKFFDTKHAQEFFAEDISVSAQARILMDRITKKFEDLFAGFAKPLAEDMADDADKNSATSLKSSLRDLTQGITLNTDILTGELRDVLKATIAENVSLIKSISSQYLDGVQGAVYRSITSGNGLADLVPFLQKHENITLRRARFIATDQVRKCYSNFNKHRMQAVGISSYEWMHVNGGQHPRKLHQSYNGRIFRFDQPPIIDEKTGQRGTVSDLPNCRCRARPIIQFDQGLNEK